MGSTRRWRSLRSRIVIWAFAPALLVLAVVAAVTLLAYERLVQEEVIGRERERTYFAANRLKVELTKFSAELSALHAPKRSTRALRRASAPPCRMRGGGCRSLTAAWYCWTTLGGS